MPGAGGGQTAGMPDARMMSGIPMPMTDLPDGTVSVRVVRGEISNTLPKQTVELIVDGKSRTAQTDDAGRAQFSGVPPGASAKAVVTVDGERIESEPFRVPDKGGVRLMLTASASPAAAGPPVAGTVTFGGNSRIDIELDDDLLTVFYVLDIVNNGAVPVNPATPIAFDLPPGAVSATVLEGSTPQAKVAGTRVSVAGPFKPGRTSVQVAYQLPSAGGSQTLVQQFPATLDAFAIAVQKVGDLRLQSPQVTEQRDVPAEGKTYVLGNGPAVPAGRAVTLELTGLPHRETWPRNVSLVLAVAILGVGAWMAFGRSSEDGTAARRRDLERQRDRLFADLLALEQANRSRKVDADVYADRRADLMRTLERIYGELDSPAPEVSRQGTPGGDDRGRAA